ncbi:MAG TPA: UbiD family decarboxylase domain-containing protein, partial [Dehalococcoidia bacterium]|nr:UbiD family decarboxylase domain-containing protein [Dehalococcoidia bacterium]
MREFIALLEQRGELRHVSAPVSWELEIAEIADRMAKGGGPALLFDNVTGYDTPVVIGLFASERRMAWALGVEHLDELVDRFHGLLEMVQGAPEGVWNKLRTLGRLVQLGSFQPKTVGRAPCQQVVLQGDAVDLFKLPILQCWPMDGGRFITLPLVITRDPQTGTQNYGTYRMQVFDRQTTGMHWQTHKVGAHHYRVSQEQGMERLEVAVA